MISKAQSIIQIAFKDKVDKGGQPYITHLERVSKNFNGETYTVALLHDLLEDCPEWSKEDLVREGFSLNVVDAVVCITEIKGESYLNYLNRVKSNYMALKVKISYLEDNMDIKRLNLLTDKDCERLKKYHKAWIELTNFV